MSALSRTNMPGALRAAWAQHARVRPVPHLRAGHALRCISETNACPPCRGLSRARVQAARRATLAQLERVSHIPYLLAGSASRCRMGRTRTRPSCPALACGERSGAFRLLSETRHARVRPVLHLRAGSASRCMGGNRMCPPRPAPACGPVRGTLRAVWARHARVRPVPHGPHLHARSTSRCMGETRTWASPTHVRPVSHLRAGSALRRMGETRTCLPYPAPVCG